MARLKNQHPTHKAKLKGTLLDLSALSYKAKTGATYFLIRKGSTIYLSVQCDATQNVADDFGVPHSTDPNETRQRLWEKALKATR